MRPLLPAMALSLVLSLPAMAGAKPVAPATGPDTVAAPTSDTVATGQPTPRLYGVILPIPLLVIYGQVGMRDIPLGSGRLQVEANGGYGWRSQAIYRTDLTAATEVAAEQDANVYGGTVFGRWTFVPSWSVRLAGSVRAGGPATTASYDPALAGGLSATVGPSLQYSTLNDTTFPTKGTLFDAGWTGGYHWGPQNQLFHRAWIEGQQYFEVGQDQTVAIRALAQAGWPGLSWVEKFGSGAVTAVRGYRWGRFTGDQHVVAMAEYRSLLFPKLISLWGVDLGLGWNAFVDVGRAWESSQGIPFPYDIRPGAGVGAYGTLNRSTIGGYALSVGTEGFNLIGFLGNSF